jgi:hypothetical protein
MNTEINRERDGAFSNIPFSLCPRFTPNAKRFHRFGVKIDGKCSSIAKLFASSPLL